MDELEAKIAKLFEELKGKVSDAALKDLIKATLKEHFGLVGDKDFSLKLILENLDALKANQDKIANSIRNTKRGAYISGLEDESFNLVRFFNSVRLQNKALAPHEWEISDQCRKALIKKGGINISDDAIAGAFVPDQVISDVIGPVYGSNAWIALNPDDGTTRISVIDGLVGDNPRIPKFDGGVVAYWMGEEDEYTESLIASKDLIGNRKKLGVLVKLSRETLDFAAFGFDSLLRRDMSKAMSKKLDYTIPYGTGSANIPRGIVNTTGVKFFEAVTRTVKTRAEMDALADLDGAIVDYTALSLMDLFLEEDDIDLDASAATISSPRFFNKLKNLKSDQWNGQADAKQLFLSGFPMLTDGALAGIIGPFGKTSQIKSNLKPGASIGTTTDSTIAQHSDVFRGNLGEVLLLRWAGIEIEDDRGMGKGFTSDHSYLKIRMYADVMVREPRSLLVCPNALVW